MLGAHVTPCAVGNGPRPCRAAPSPQALYATQRLGLFGAGAMAHLAYLAAVGSAAGLWTFYKWQIDSEVAPSRRGGGRPNPFRPGRDGF